LEGWNDGKMGTELAGQKEFGGTIHQNPGSLGVLIAGLISLLGILGIVAVIFRM
jgi:hypothetical protein